jgi:CRP-like cAMP-binding protein
MSDSIPAGELHPQMNQLLSSLSATSRDRLLRHMQLVTLPLGRVLYEPGDTSRHVYFPTDSTVALQDVLPTGQCALLAVVGNDGMVGLAIAAGGESLPGRAVVQSDGHAYRLAGQLLKPELNRQVDLVQEIFSYTRRLTVQMARSAFCVRQHSVIERMARWLLLTLDRGASLSWSIPSELMANVLGVRREVAVRTAGLLQERGVIQYDENMLLVRDRLALVKQCCDCFETRPDAIARAESARSVAVAAAADTQ